MSRSRSSLLHLLVHPHVVGADAGLAGVGPLGEGDPAGGELEVGVLVDDDRRLAAELQRDRRQVLGRGLGDDPPDRAVAGVEDVVPALLEQRGGLGDAALDHDDRLRVDVPREQPGQRGGGLRRHLGGLADHGVARRERRHQRGEQQVDRVVPRRDDQHHAQRGVLDRGAVGAQQEGDRGLGRGQPLLQVLLGVLDLAPGAAQVGQPRLVARLAQVDRQGVEELVLALPDHPAQPGELLAAPLLGAGPAGGEGGAQSLGQPLDPGGVVSWVRRCGDPRLAHRVTPDLLADVDSDSDTVNVVDGQSGPKRVPMSRAIAGDLGASSRVETFLAVSRSRRRSPAHRCSITEAAVGG